MPLVAWHTPADVQGFDIPFNGTCNETRSRIFRRGYYASVAYTDYNIGKLIDTLDELQVAKKTIIVVFGDHGWQLGEHDLWAKMSMFEAATHIPFIMRAPWMTESVGKVTWAFTEMVKPRSFFPASDLTPRLRCGFWTGRRLPDAGGAGRAARPGLQGRAPQRDLHGATVRRP